MAITIELSLEKENTLREEAALHGLAMNDYARALVERHLPADPETNGWPSDFFENTFGSLSEEPAAERFPQTKYEEREPLS